MTTNAKKSHVDGCLLVLAIALAWCALPQTANALTGTHQVIVGYNPLFPRWYTPEDCLWIGDPTRQYPLLGLYNNTTDTNVIRFDFGCIKNMGGTVVCTPIEGSPLNTTLINRFVTASADVGIKWAPTFPGFTADPVGMANYTNTFMASYGSSPNLFRYDNRPVVFWRLARDADPTANPPIVAMTESDIAYACELVRAASGPVFIVLDAQCLGSPCMTMNNAISQWYSDPDASTGYSRVSGFYEWDAIVWSQLSRSARQTSANNFVNRCVAGNMIPVLSTSVSFNEENWGYGEEGDNCGIDGDRSNYPHYNTTRSLTEWEYNLNDLLYNNHPNAWIYIQAYDEWAEGSTIAPTTYGCFDFLVKVRTVLQSKGWLSELACYCRPNYPAGYNPSGCTSTPPCSSGSCSGGSTPAGGGSTPGAIATYQAEGGSAYHVTGFQTSNGWRATVNCTHDTYLTFGPYATNIPTGNQTARFWLSVDNNTADNNPIARIEVNDATTGTVLAQQLLTRQQWTQTNIYRPFDLAFNNAVAGHQLEFRVYYVWYSQLDHDKTEILGNTVAVYQGSSAFGHLCGSAIANNDWRVTVASSNCWMAYGPYDTTLPAGALKARFWLRVDNNTADDKNICKIDVWDATASTRLAGQMTISRKDWSQAGVYQAFDLNFTNPGGAHMIEFRTYYIWYSQLDLDRVEVTYP